LILAYEQIERTRTQAMQRYFLPLVVTLACTAATEMTRVGAIKLARHPQLDFDANYFSTAVEPAIQLVSLCPCSSCQCAPVALAISGSK